MDISLAWETIKGWVNDFFALLPNIAVAILVFGLMLMVGKFLRRTIINLTENKQNSKSLGLVMGRLVYGGTIIAGVFIALMIVVPSINAGQLVGALGIGSVAIGFAFKDILQNFLAGVLILLTQPFKIGDQIEVNSFEGTVENIEMRATTIKTFDSRRVVIPNANMFNQSVTVNTAFDKRRIQYDFGIGYGDDIDQAKAILLDVIRNHKDVLTEPEPEVLTVDLADSSVVIRARWWTEVPTTNWGRAKEEIISEVKRFTQEGIDIPYPIQTLYVKNENS